MDFKINLPIDLLSYKEQFLKSARSFIKITTKDPTTSKPWESKIGGTPYLPIDIDFPKNEKGLPLFFLAQINFAETPILHPFPQSGILQFYINDSGNYGLDYEVPDEQNNFRILFFENIEKDEELLQMDIFNREYMDTPIPADISLPVHFEIANEIVPLSDHNIHDFIGEDFFNRFGPRQWEVMAAYNQQIKSNGHKMGGYAFFTQEDIRYEMGEYELLFQLDSDQKINCQWGDMGVANFFITKEDLIKKDFSKVLYNWDCY